MCCMHWTGALNALVLYILDLCVACTVLMCWMYGLVCYTYWTDWSVVKGNQNISGAMRQDHVVEAVGHEHINVP